MNLRALARGRECQVRIPGICNRDPATTVLANVRMAGITGVGMKAHDFLGAHCCSACHDATDGRTQTLHSRDYLRLAHLEGVVRTLAILLGEGAIK